MVRERDTWMGGRVWKLKASGSDSSIELLTTDVDAALVGSFTVGTNCVDSIEPRTIVDET
jgi:hypothetical protein